MPTSIHYTELELAPGLAAYAAQIDDDRLVTWPTELDERETVRKLLEVLEVSKDTAGWPTEVMVNMRVISVTDFLAEGEPVLTDEKGLVRFNAGAHPKGFSVVALIVDGTRELQGVFARDDDELATKVIEGTIVANGLERVAEIVRLGRSE